MAMIKHTVVTILFCIAAVTAVRAEELLSVPYDVSFQLLEEPRNPRLTGMGGVGTALSDRGFYYYNPAMPAWYAPRYLGIEYGKSYSELALSAVEAALGIQDWFLALTIPAAVLDDITPASEQGRAEYARFTWQTTFAALDIGYRTDRLSAAVCIYGLQERIGTERSYGMSISAGMQFRAIPQKLTFGAAGFYPAFLTGTTGMLDHKKDLGAGTDLAQLGRIGAAWSDSIKGIAYTAALDVAYNYDIGSVTVPIGLEVKPFNFLALRIGKRINHDTDKFAFGFGLLYRQLRFDSSFTIQRFVEDTDLKWLLGLTYALEKSDKS